MCAVLLKLDEEHEKRLRELAKQKFGEKKGSLVKTVEQLIDEKTENKKNKRLAALKKLDEFVEKNKHKLKLGYKFDREEIYAERTGRL